MKIMNEIWIKFEVRITPVECATNLRKSTLKEFKTLRIDFSSLCHFSTTMTEIYEAENLQTSSLTTELNASSIFDCFCISMMV